MSHIEAPSMITLQLTQRERAKKCHWDVNVTYIPVEAPLGTAARNMPLEVKRSTSTVGLPRLSTICRPLSLVITPGTAFLNWSA